jgi:SAM-dependent methyltransferase
VTRPCAICGGALALLHRGAGASDPAALAPTCHAVGAHGDLYACAACGTIHQPGLPGGAALVDLYRAMADPAYLGEEAGRRATARRLLDRLERHVAPGRLLEAGCGHGLLLDEARARGWAVRGLEPSDAARRHARDALGLDVRAEPLEAVDPAVDGPYDAVALVDVLEHLDDPVGAVRTCASLLAPAGALLVVTPDPASLTARVAGARWWGLLPAHAHLLPRRTLLALLSREGLEPLDDVGLRRTFSLRWWARGLGERAGVVGRVLARAPAGLPVTLSLGDERVVVARRAAAAPAAG